MKNLENSRELPCSWLISEQNTIMCYVGLEYIPGGAFTSLKFLVNQSSQHVSELDAFIFSAISEEELKGGFGINLAQHTCHSVLIQQIAVIRFNDQRFILLFDLFECCQNQDVIQQPFIGLILFWKVFFLDGAGKQTDSAIATLSQFRSARGKIKLCLLAHAFPFLFTFLAPLAFGIERMNQPIDLPAGGTIGYHCRNGEETTGATLLDWFIKGHAKIAAFIKKDSSLFHRGIEKKREMLPRSRRPCKNAYGNADHIDLKPSREHLGITHSLISSIHHLLAFLVSCKALKSGFLHYRGLSA